MQYLHIVILLLPVHETVAINFSLCFSKAFVESIQSELAKFSEDVRDDVVILFSAHSLPLKVRVYVGFNIEFLSE